MTLRQLPPNRVRQNARPILALAGFKRVISVIKHQEFMPDPNGANLTNTRVNPAPLGAWSLVHDDFQRLAQPFRERI